MYAITARPERSASPRPFPSAFFRFLYTLEVPRDPATRRPLQTGAIPWRCTGSGVEVLLITGRSSGKWIIPKGWPMLFRSLADAAAREAYEEAGVRGRVSPEPLGRIDAPKSYRFAGTIDWLLVVHAMEVTEELDTWPEQHQRRRKWLSIDEAAGRVRPKALAPLIRAVASLVPPQQR